MEAAGEEEGGEGQSKIPECVGEKEKRKEKRKIENSIQIKREILIELNQI